MKSIITKALITKVLIAVVALLLLLWIVDESSTKEQSNNESDLLAKVSVINVKPQSEQSRISVTGLVKSRWQIALTANVRGQVTNSFESILPGTFVQKDDVLVLIDDIEYSAALATAKANEASAKLELERILNEQSVAKRIDNGVAANDYRLFKPHVETAQASVQAAKANVAATLKQLNDTKIKVPFDAIVLAKHIVPSQQLNMGEVVYTLASSQALDIEVSLSSQQWKKLDINQDTIADVKDVFNTSYQAKVRYLSPVLNTQTRQREVVLAVDSPFKDQKKLLPEQQVTVTFSSKLIANAVTTPATVLTRDNKVWTVIDNKLVQESVNLIDESAGSVMFTFVNKADIARQIVLYPLSTMLVGQTVQVNPVNNTQGE